MSQSPSSTSSSPARSNADRRKSLQRSPSSPRSTNSSSISSRLSIDPRVDKHPDSRGSSPDINVEERVASQLPEDLDEAHEYTFKKGDEVWIKADNGVWLPGVVDHVKKEGPTRMGQEKYYVVRYGKTAGKATRKSVAPLNGEVKPNKSHVVKLLREAGYDSAWSKPF